MIIYLTIASLYASKPSKIPSSPKVGQELYEQYCSGCHGKVDKEEEDKEDENANEKSENVRTENIKTQNTNPPATLSKQTQPSGLDTLAVLSKKSLSSPIEFNGKKEIPSLFENSYSEKEWIKWVLVGEGMMPGYSEILHSTDAIKIKSYLDGL